MNQVTQEQVEQQLIQAIQSCLEAGGKQIPIMTPDTIPLKDLGDFDSVCAIEVLVDLETKIQKELEEDLFVEGSGIKARPRTIREIAHAIAATKSKKKGGAKQHA